MPSTENSAQLLRKEGGGLASPAVPNDRRWFVVPLVAFAASRLVVVGAAYLLRYLSPGWGVLGVLAGRWDSTWYFRVAREGYPSVLPEGTGNPAQTTLGFFPVFPMVTKAVSKLLGIGLPTAALLVNTVAAAVAVLLLWRLTRLLFDRETADRTAFLFCFFPGSYAFSYAYTEAVFLACAIGFLLLVHTERYWAAAAVGAFGSAVRPNGYVFALCLAFVVLTAWRRSGRRRPPATVFAPAVAFAGFAAFMVYLHFHLGDAMAWQRALERGWGQRLDITSTAFHRTVDYFTAPNEYLNFLVPAALVLLLIPWAWLFLKARLPAVFVLYTAAMLIPILLSSALALTPRHVLVAFPLFMAAGWALRTYAYTTAVTLSTAVLVGLVIMAGFNVEFTP